MSSSFPLIPLNSKRVPLVKYKSLLDAGKDWKEVYRDIDGILNPNCDGYGIIPLSLGLIVLDIDDPGKSPLSPEQFDSLPAFCKVMTPSEGHYHIWLKESKKSYPELISGNSPEVSNQDVSGDLVNLCKKVICEVKHNAVVPLPGSRRKMDDGKEGNYTCFDDRITEATHFLRQNFPQEDAILDVILSRAAKTKEVALDGIKVKRKQENKDFNLSKDNAVIGGDISEYRRLLLDKWGVISTDPKTYTSDIIKRFIKACYAGKAAF